MLVERMGLRPADKPGPPRQTAANEDDLQKANGSDSVEEWSGRQTANRSPRDDDDDNSERGCP